MAWTCSASSNAGLVANLTRARLLLTDRVIAAFRATDRRRFLQQSALAADAYSDSPADIGFGATISAPHMHAQCVEALVPALRAGARVLDVGSGSGYLCAVFARLVGADGVVLGVDHVPELVARASAALDDDLPKPLRAVVLVRVGDARKPLNTIGGFDVIHVGAAETCLPQELISLLNPGGRLIVPVNDELVLVSRSAKGETQSVRRFVRGGPLRTASPRAPTRSTLPPAPNTSRRRSRTCATCRLRH